MADVHDDVCIYRGAVTRSTTTARRRWGSRPHAGDMGRMVGGLRTIATGASANSAPGAVTTVGFTADTTLEGPWDRATLLHGTQLIAVRHDVFVAIDLQSADYASAERLLAAICARL